MSDDVVPISENSNFENAVPKGFRIVDYIKTSGRFKGIYRRVIFSLHLPRFTYLKQSLESMKMKLFETNTQKFTFSTHLCPR